MEARALEVEAVVVVEGAGEQELPRPVFRYNHRQEEMILCQLRSHLVQVLSFLVS